jgi:hypothetical protein
MKSKTKMIRGGSVEYDDFKKKIEELDNKFQELSKIGNTNSKNYINYEINLENIDTSIIQNFLDLLVKYKSMLRQRAIHIIYQLLYQTHRELDQYIDKYSSIGHVNVVSYNEIYIDLKLSSNFKSKTICKISKPGFSGEIRYWYKTPSGEKYVEIGDDFERGNNKLTTKFFQLDDSEEAVYNVIMEAIREIEKFKPKKNNI